MQKLTREEKFFGNVTFYGGADRGRTGDLTNAIRALCQLSYSPTCFLEYQTQKRAQLLLRIIHYTPY